MKILITGGYGFIGSQLTKIFVDSGDDVIVYDDFKHYAKSGDFQRALKLRKPLVKGAKIVTADIRDRLRFREVLAEEKPEIVIHLAAIPLYRPRPIYDESITDVNLWGTINVIEESAKAKSVRRFVYASSSMAYGDFRSFAPNEDEPLQPLDRYGVTKACGEMYLRQTFQDAKKDWIVMRPSAVYGSRDCNNRVVQIFVNAGFDGQNEIRVTSGQRLDFTHVKDAAMGFYLASQTKHVNEVYNLTAGQEREILELAKLVQKHFPDLKIKEQMIDDAGPIRGELNIGKAKRLLKYEPKYRLEQGLEEYIEFEKKNR
jgi:nucleoside-diphosphate-sugar epimerase